MGQVLQTADILSGLFKTRHYLENRDRSGQRPGCLSKDPTKRTCQ